MPNYSMLSRIKAMAPRGDLTCKHVVTLLYDDAYNFDYLRHFTKSLSSL